MNESGIIYSLLLFCLKEEKSHFYPHFTVFTLIVSLSTSVYLPSKKNGCHGDQKVISLLLNPKLLLMCVGGVWMIVFSDGQMISDVWMWALKVVKTAGTNVEIYFILPFTAQSALIAEMHSIFTITVKLRMYNRTFLGNNIPPNAYNTSGCVYSTNVINCKQPRVFHRGGWLIRSLKLKWKPPGLCEHIISILGFIQFNWRQ